MNEEIKKHYKKLYEINGEAPASLQWSNRETQIKRFEILSQVSDNLRSVIDLGCGLGDFYSYLKNKFKIEAYLGLDFVEEFIQVAQKRFADDINAQFQLFDITKQNLPTNYDYILLSGVFNNKTDDNENQMYNSITKMFESCKKGVAFNAMSTYVDFFDEKLFYVNPLEVFDFCKKNLTRKVTLRHDYLVKENSIPFEFTIYLYK